MRQLRHDHQPGKAGRCHRVKPRKGTKPSSTSKRGLSPEAWEKIARLLISSLEPIAKLLDAISKLH